MVVGDKVVVDDMGEGMQCSDHPYRSNPGGICAFCLQEKLGKLVSSSKSNPFFPIPSGASSSSPSFRADVAFGDSVAVSAASRTKIHFLSSSNGSINGYGNSNGNKKKNGSSTSLAYMSSGSRKTGTTNMGKSNNLVLKRSKSVAPSTRTVTEGGTLDVAADSPRKKSFWSFLNLSAAGNNQRRPSSSSSGESRDLRQQHYGSSSSSLAVGKEVDGRTPGREQLDVDSPNESQGASSFGRKVARSRSVGCGSRSFSGDFLERISTGFGDCTLRRVESHRETKPKIVLHRITGADQNGDEQRFKERVKCGGIFGGFGMISSYSYFAEDYESASTTRSTASDLTREGGTPHGRSRSWSWAFSSSRRALRPSSASKPYARRMDETPSSVISAINNTVVVGTPAAAPHLR
ncbi:hypothetical protein IHE45_10G000300 [Dioscorea alata]|uniref:Uncharacterized protein n=1 Tax=Dioscorea alata TaxID=55571 RepID=A0ACB7V8W1_DIOAL|nr:hypothetical protein IHE45_10G000300 [Dioscorea alata]